MPLFGLELLDMAYDVATLNLPSRVGQLSESAYGDRSERPPLSVLYREDSSLN
jgi:hypothetical protein